MRVWGVVLGWFPASLVRDVSKQCRQRFLKRHILWKGEARAGSDEKRRRKKGMIGRRVGKGNVYFGHQ
jgi:hypothetical protein